MSKLHRKMTAEQFKTGYWYVSELKAFARSLDMRGYSKQRKDQLEARLLQYLAGEQATVERQTVANGEGADTLALDAAVMRYVSNRSTKQFIVQQAQKQCPNLPAKSGRWYWLNRWREQQLEHNIPITYGDLVEKMIELCSHGGRLPQIPSARFNNFVSDFLAEQRGSRAEALAAWKALKKSTLPKTYSAWKSANN